VCHVDTSIRCIAIERLHGKTVPCKNIFLSNFYQRPAIGNTTPRFIEKVSRERVQDDVDAFTVCYFHDLGSERCGSRREDVFWWDPEGRGQEVSFFVRAYRCEYLKAVFRWQLKRIN
jgi:hypothetical protein